MENKMFCYQCQETAGCRGCTVAGVCGKKPEVAAMQDLLVYVLLKHLDHYHLSNRKNLMLLRHRKVSYHRTLIHLCGILLLTRRSQLLHLRLKRFVK